MIYYYGAISIITRCGSVWYERRRACSPAPCSENRLATRVRDVEAASSCPSQFNNEVWLSLVERYVRDVEAASSNLVTSTKKQPKTSYFDLFSAFFLYIFHKIGCFQLTTCLPDFGAFCWIFHGFFSILFKIPFLCLLRRKF